MLDALFPFVDTLVERVNAGASGSDAWRSAADACRTAAEATASLVPKIGRARPLAERSVGTPDPGAISLGLIVTAIGDVLTDAELAAPAASESMDKEGQPT
jgi:dihydroxyacetone kinase